MLRKTLIICMYLSAAIGLAAGLDVWRLTWEGATKRDAGFLAVLLGDGRRVFAGHFFAKADIYYHNGNYPSVFAQANRDSYLARGAGLTASEPSHAESHEGGKPLDWLEKFGRNFFPSRHTHIDETGSRRQKGHEGHDHAGHDHEGHDHGSHESKPKDDEVQAVKEILPWLKFSARMDPSRVETYVTTSFWLRRMGKNKEAMDFLREGWVANPRSYEIMFEMGRIYEQQKDDERARNLFELAIRRWGEQEIPKKEPNLFMALQLYTHLGELERRAGNKALAIKYLRSAKGLSPNPEALQKQIDELQQTP